MFEEANEEMTTEEVLEIQNAHLEKYFQEFITSTTNEGRDSADTNLIKQEVEIPLKSSKGKRLRKVGLTSTDDYIRENCLVARNNEVSMMSEQAGPNDSLGAVHRLPGPWMVLPTKKNRLEGDSRPEPRDPPFDSQVAPAYMCRVIVLRRLVSRGRRGILLNNHNGMATWTKERISTLLGTEARRICPAGRVSRKDGGYQKRKYVWTCGVSRKDRTYDADTKKENMIEHAERHERTKPMTTDTKKENMSGRAEYCGRMGPMTANTKKENMSGHAKRHGRTEPMTADSKKENMTGHVERHERTDPMIVDTKKENISERTEYRGRTGPMTADTKKENMSGHVKRHGRTEPMTADSKKENMFGRA
nr:hypothetical protein [Tanacetum cinerariifolium]